MKNHTDGWDKAIAEVNARMTNGVIVDLKSDAPVKQEPEAPTTEADQRGALIKNFCTKLGVPVGVARKYRFDIRPLHRITNDIFSRSLGGRVVARERPPGAVRI